MNIDFKLMDTYQEIFNCIIIKKSEEINKLIEDNNFEFLIKNYNQLIDINKTYEITNNGLKINYTLLTYALKNQDDYIYELLLKYFDNIDFSYNDYYIILKLCHDNNIELIDYIFSNHSILPTDELIAKIFNSLLDEHFDGIYAYDYGNYADDIEIYFINNFGIEFMKDLEFKKIFSNGTLDYLKKYVNYGLFNVINIFQVFEYFIYYTHAKIEIFKYFLELDGSLMNDFDFDKFLNESHSGLTILYIMKNYSEFLFNIDKNILFQKLCKHNLNSVKFLLEYFPDIDVKNDKIAINNALNNNITIARYLINTYFFD